MVLKKSFGKEFECALTKTFAAFYFDKNSAQQISRKNAAKDDFCNASTFPIVTTIILQQSRCVFIGVVT
jgi:hypothetical protein